MYKGSYIAMTGAVLRSQELDNVANNLANVSTVGYKKTTFSSQLYPLMKGAASGGNYVYPEARAMSDAGRYHIDISEGSIKATGNTLDFAVNGEGFFAVESAGRTLYTRNGVFSKNKEGFIVTENGFKVLDTSNKPIRIENGTISVSPDGNIYSDGNVAGKLKLTNIKKVTHVGNSLFSGDESGSAKGEIVQGSIEMSNVNPVSELVGIISAMREYESAQKVIQNFDQLAQRSVSEIAKV